MGKVPNEAKAGSGFSFLPCDGRNGVFSQLGNWYQFPGA